MSVIQVIMIFITIGIALTFICLSISRNALDKDKSKRNLSNLVDSTKGDRINKDNTAEQMNLILNSQIRNTSDDEYVKEINREILETRIRLAKYALAKWEEEQKKKIESNLEDYIKS